MAAYDTTALLASIRRRASIPNTAVTGSADSDLLAYADEELQLRLIADIMAVREEYFVKHSNATITSATSYRIPSRAIGGKLRGVFLLDSADAVIDTLDRIEPERVEDYQGAGSLSAFMVEGGAVILVPNSTTTASKIRLSYFLRPSVLSNTATDYATVSSVAGNVITTSAAHGFTSSTSLDVIKGKPGFDAQVLDTSPTSTTSTTLTFSSLSGLSIVADDYVCKADKAPVPMIPAEFHPILAQRVALKFLQAINDPGVPDAKAELREMEEKVGILISPRVDGATQKIINRHGALGGSRWRLRYGGD